MNEKNKKLDLGRELAEQRETKEMSVQQLSKRTKIAVKNIENIENGIFDFLPSAYVKAYLSAISVELGLDPEVILRKYKASFVRDVDTSSFEEFKPVEKKKKHVEKELLPVKVKEPRKPKEPKKVKEKSGSSKKWLEEVLLIIRFYSVFIFGALFVLVVLVIVFWVLPELKLDKKSQNQPVTPEQPDSLVVQTKVQPAVSIPVEPEVKNLELKMTMTDSSWIRIVYDDSIAVEAIYAPGDEKTWQSKGPFYLRIGNASGVQLTLDGKYLGKPGRKGQITNILVDEKGFKNIKKTEFPQAMGVGGTTQ